MKGQKRNAIIAASVAVLFLAGYFLILFFPKESSKTQEGENGDVYVLEYKLADVDSITVFKTGEKAYTLKVKTVSDGTNTFSVLGKESASYNQSSLSSVASSVVYPLATLKVEDNASNLSKYGLDSSKTYFLISLKDGTSDKLIVGNLTSAKDGYYVKAERSSAVYVMTEYYVESLLKDEGLYRITDIFQSVEGIPDNVTGAYIEKQGKALVDVRLSDNIMDGKFKFAYKYALTAPHVMPVETETFQSKFLNLLSNISAEGVEVDNPSDLSKYGLDKPYGKITVKTTKELKTLLIGNASGDNRYCMIDGEKAVLLVAQSSLGLLDLSYNDIISNLVLIRDISTLDTLTFKAKSDTYVMTFKPSGEEKKLNITLNGTAVDDSKGRNAYMNVISILSAGELKSVPTGAAEYSVYFKYKDGKTEKFEFIKQNERQYAISIDGKAELYCNITDIQKAVDSLKALTEKK